VRGVVSDGQQMRGVRSAGWASARRGASAAEPTAVRNTRREHAPMRAEYTCVDLARGSGRIVERAFRILTPASFQKEGPMKPAYRGRDSSQALRRARP